MNILEKEQSLLQKLQSNCSSSGAPRDSVERQGKPANKKNIPSRTTSSNNLRVGEIMLIRAIENDDHVRMKLNSNYPQTDPEYC